MHGVPKRTAGQSTGTHWGLGKGQGMPPPLHRTPIHQPRYFLQCRPHRENSQQTIPRVCERRVRHKLAQQGTVRSEPTEPAWQTEYLTETAGQECETEPTPTRWLGGKRIQHRAKRRRVVQCQGSNKMAKNKKPGYASASVGRPPSENAQAGMRSSG